MQTIHLLWFLRGLAGFAIGFFIARKLRDFIRSIVIMCIPLKHRISERSFQIQTRITTLVSILLMIAIAVGLNWGLSKGLTQMGITQKTTIHGAATSTPAIQWPTQPIIPPPAKEQSPTPPTTTPPKKIPPPVTTFEAPIAIPANRPSQPIKYASPPTPQVYQQQVPPPIVYQNPTPPSTYAAFTIYYYAQLYAFRDFEKAQAQQLKWNSHSQLPVRIGFVGQEFAPYKVIIGPFKHRQAATSFLRHHQLKGFARPAHQLQLFE